MKVNRQDLLSVIRRVAPFAKTRTTQPILSMVKIEALNGRLHATASDGQAFVESICECDGNEMPYCVSPGPLLALSAYGPDTLDLSVDKNRLKVKCGAMASLSTLDAKEFPAWPEDTKALGVNPCDLAEAISSVAWAANPSARSYAETMKRVVWIDMNTKEHFMVAMAYDGRRFAMVNKSAVVPNARLIFYTENADILVEALRVDKSSISTNASWIVAGGECLRVAINQVEPFEMPIKNINKLHNEAQYAGTIPRESTLTELTTMQAMATYEEMVYAKGELSDGGFKLDFVGKTNEFHSVVSGSPREPNAKSGPTDSNARAGAKAKSQNLTAPNPAWFSFDAALLHDVLKHTPGENIACRINDRNAFFEGEGVLTALALVSPL